MVNRSIPKNQAATLQPLVDRAFEQFEVVSQRLLQILAPHGQLACRAGCSHCCLQQVSVTAPEVFRLADFMRSSWARDDVDKRLARVRGVAETVRGISAAEHRGTECPFLDDGRCSVYVVRPLVCRGANSMDAAACGRPGAPVPVYVELWNAAQQLQEQLDREAHKTTGRREMFELSCAVTVALEHPDAEARWRNGELILASARHSWFEGDVLRHWQRSPPIR